MEITFTLNGEKVTLSTTQIETAIAGVEPEPLRTHAVEINGRLYPIKQPFALALGLDRLDFTTHQARTQLRRLGLPVSRVDSGHPASGA